MDYFKESLQINLLSDQLFYEEMLEQLEIERDFMISCLENNIILEAEAPATEKKGNWLQTIKEAIKKLFDKFVSMLEELVKADEAWIKNNIDKLGGINYKGLSVKTLEYWKVEPSSVTNILSELQKEVNNINPDDAKLKTLQSREAVENYGAFKKYRKGKKDFAESIKIKFKVGDSNEPNTVELSGDALKKQCVGEMAKYVVGYKSTLLPSLKSAKTNFDNMLNGVERKLNNSKSVSEAFCLLENANYSDTELRFCMNYNAVFEAEEPAKPETKKPEEKKEEPKMNQVQDTSKGDVKNPKKADEVVTGSSEYYNYVKIAIQLNQTALAAAMTAYEERYRAYMAILKGVITAREPKK